MKKTTIKRAHIAPDGEKRLVIVFDRQFVTPQKLCDRCAEPSGMITPEEAAALVDVSTRVVYRWLETDTIHFSDTAESGLLICLNSLAASGMVEDSEEVAAES